MMQMDCAPCMAPCGHIPYEEGEQERGRDEQLCFHKHGFNDDAEGVKW